MNSIYFISIIVSIISLNNASIEEIRKEFEQATNALNFTGKVALMTGSATGIGAECARLFAYLGGQVVITNVEPNSVRTVAEECQQLSPYKIKPLEVVADLTNGEDVKRLVAETIKHHGKIDILVNIAAVLIPAKISDNTYLELFDKHFNVNLRGSSYLTGLVVPYLRQTNGTIIYFASCRSPNIPMPPATPYDLTKAAIVQMMRTLAVELAPNIRVNSVSPCKIPGTQLTKPFWPFFHKLVDKTPMGRSGRPLDIAKSVMFLASPLAQWISGQNLPIDGGFYGDINFEKIALT